MLLVEVVTALSAARVRFAVAGGYAVALHGAVRGTVDLDLVLALDEENYSAAEAALTGIGLSSRLPVSARDVFRFRREYVANRNLIAWSFYDARDPSRLVDIVITYEKRRLAVKRVHYRGTSIPLLSKRELIRMKEEAGRPQDLEDARALRSLK